MSFDEPGRCDSKFREIKINSGFSSFRGKFPKDGWRNKEKGKL
jgi:hypothetical protein